MKIKLQKAILVLCPDCLLIQKDQTIVLKEKVDLISNLDLAMAYLDDLLEDKRKKVSDENRYRAESRIAALRKGTEIRNERLEQQIKNHITNRIDEGRAPDENYIRLTKSRIEKENAKLTYSIIDLQKRQMLTLDYNLQAIAYVRVFG